MNVRETRQLLRTLPFALIVLVGSIPVALPATFTFSQALGAQELSGEGVLATRLSAIEEAASGHPLQRQDGYTDPEQVHGGDAPADRPPHRS